MANNTTITKGELISLVAEKAGQPVVDTKHVVNAIFEEVVRLVAEGADVRLTGFGTFTSRYREARTARQPGSTNVVNVPAATVPKFKPGKGFKEAVNEKELIETTA